MRHIHIHVHIRDMTHPHVWRNPIIFLVLKIDLKIHLKIEWKIDWLKTIMRNDDELTLEIQHLFAVGSGQERLNSILIVDSNVCPLHFTKCMLLCMCIHIYIYIYVYICIYMYT